MPLHRAEIRLQPPDGDDHLLRHAELLLDAGERVGMLGEHALGALQARRDHAAGELLKALLEDLLVAVEPDRRVAVADAARAPRRRCRCEMPCAAASPLEILDPGLEAGGIVAAGRGERRRRRAREGRGKDERRAVCSKSHGSPPISCRRGCYVGGRDRATGRRQVQAGVRLRHPHALIPRKCGH